MTDKKLQIRQRNRANKVSKIFGIKNKICKVESGNGRLL